MSKFDKYREPKASSKFDKYRMAPEIAAEPEGDSWGALLPKALATGATSIAEAPKILELPYNMMYGADHPSKVKAQQRLEQLDPSTYKQEPSLLDRFREMIKPNPDTAAKRIASNAGEFAGGSFLLPGANLLRNFGLGAAIGGASGVAQEAGVNPLVADIAATAAVPFAPRVPKLATEGGKRAILGLSGLGKGKLNIEALEAAKRLGIELPTAAATSSTALDLADSVIGKAPYFGDKLRRKYDTSIDQTKKALEDLYETVGPKDTPELTNKIAKLYDEAAAALPHDARVVPTNTIKNIDYVKNNIVTPIPNAGENKLLSTVADLDSAYRPMNINRVPAEVKSLIGAKKSLNTDIDWDKHQGVKELLKKVRTGITEDIKEYGGTNQAWHKPHTEADALFGKKARRKKLETMFEKAVNPATDTLSHNTLAKTILSEKNSKRLSNVVGPEAHQKLKDLAAVSKAMAKKSGRIANPSGTATTATTLSLIGGLFTAPMTTIASSIGAAAMSELLTNQKFLDIALDMAKNKPSLSKTMQFNKYVKDITGKTPAILSRELNRRND